MNRDRLRQTLREAEDVRTLPYDDRTGTSIRPGSIIIGTLTVGVGHSLAKPLSDAAINFLLEEDINEAIATLDRLCPWWTTLTEPRQRALCEISFQLGAKTLMEFQPTLNLLAEGNYREAANHLRKSAWYGQCRSRVQRIAHMLEAGTDSQKWA